MAMIVEPIDATVQRFLAELMVKSDIYITAQYTPGEGLRVQCGNGEAVITYGRRVELFRGLSLVAQHCKEENYYTEQPIRFATNGLMLDCSRNAVMKPEQVKKLVTYMAAMGLDSLMLYTEDTYEIPDYPYFGHLRGRYTQAELRDLDGYCEQYGITLIPCIQTLAHLNQMMRWPFFADVRDCNDILLCGEEKTYALIESMLRSCRESFQTDRIHIGMDEAAMLGCGQYRVKNLPEDKEIIFCRHLEQVVRLCEKYGYKPMIWSDMFFRMANGGEYYGTNPVDEAIAQLVPENVELVYWDYYSPDKDHYCKLLDAHGTFHNPVHFAGASWRWLGYTPAIEKSFVHTRSALDACLEKNVEQVFVTAWGDDGSEASFMTALPVMQLYAEYGYCGGATNEELDARLFACTRQRLADMLLLDLPNRPAGKLPEDITANPSKYLLYQDVMAGWFHYHSDNSYSQQYAEYARQLEKAVQHTGKLSYLFDTLAKLCRALEIKSTITGQIRKAYEDQDRQMLQLLVSQTLPELLNRIQAFHKAVAYQWATENKIQGYEVIDIRLGGLESRVNSAICRLTAYLSGELVSLPELEEAVLPADFMQTTIEKEICQPSWRFIFSAGNI